VDKRIFSGILLTALALSMSLMVFNTAVRQVKAAPNPWEMPVIYIQSISLGPSTLRVNVAIYNLTNTFYPTDKEWHPAEPLGPYVTGPSSQFNYSLGNLYAFDISISWNPAILSYTSHVKTVPRCTAPQPFRSRGALNSPVMLAVDNVDPVAGTYRLGYTSQYPASSFNAPTDAANVFSMTFTILGPGDYGLSLDSVDLAVDNIQFPHVQPQIPYRVVLDPHLPHNTGVEAAPRNKDIIGEAMRFDTYALMKNAGDSPETFSVTIYATNSVGDYIVGNASTTAPARSTQTIKVTCTTTGLAKGTYSIRAITDTATNETYNADNELTQSTIFITLVGDIDGSRSVNIFDIVKMAGSYGACLPSPRYDPYADIDNDGCCSDIFDIVRCARNYGRSW
jgi:hypothetical protein